MGAYDGCECIIISQYNQKELAERFGIDEDIDDMLPIGFFLLTEYESIDDYDLIANVN